MGIALIAIGALIMMGVGVKMIVNNEEPVKAVPVPTTIQASPFQKESSKATTAHESFKEPMFKSGDHRIVKRRDGQYEVQYYSEHPDWHSYTGTYESIGRAQHLIDLLNGKVKIESDYDIIEKLPVQRKPQ